MSVFKNVAGQFLCIFLLIDYRGQLTRAVELFEKAIQLTRSEDGMNNLCCMLVGAKTQFKILQQFSGAPQNIYV